jgi:hypothetical protein
MSVGYTASGLHHISFLDEGALAAASQEPPAGLPPLDIAGLRYLKWPLPTRSPAIEEIVTWRDRLDASYKGQLGERLTWDETSAFTLSEDVAVSCDLALRYVAARIDERGPSPLRDLAGADRQPRDEIERALARVEARGFTCRFPQLSLAGLYWLPFERNLIIEAPDWRGKTQRFGSIYRLAEEISDIRAMLQEADPKCVEWTAMREAPSQPLSAAWQASETLARIGAAACERRLPLWTTG